MNENVMIGLVSNAALLMSLGLIYDAVSRKSRAYSTLYQVVSGLIIGGMAIVLMMTPVRWEPGVIFDTRTILLGLTGLFFGAIPTFIAMAIAAAYRLSLGGSGIVTGVATIVSSGLIGLIWRQYRFRRLEELSLLELYLFGTVIHVTMILCMLLMPQELAQKLITSLALPIMIVYPVVSALLGMLLSNRKRRYLIEEELRDNRSFLDSIFENIPNMVFVKNAADLRFMKFNRAGEELLGVRREELIGKNDYDLFSKHDADLFTAKDREVLAGTRVVDIPEEPLNVQSGQRLLHTKKIAIADRNGVPRYLLGISEDITERKQAAEERLKLERQLLHAQKLESLGVLAGGIAHDFNNILTAIIGNADLALMRINPESPAVENLRRIGLSASRAAELARQMLAYSGRGKFVVESLDLNSLLDEMLQMLKVSISKKALLQLNLAPTLPTVEADATQLRQIVMNLVINASEAIGDASGVIAITTGCRECDRDYLKSEWLDEGLPDGLYVYFEISDSGCGMDRETLSRIFDPFFTTKFTGRGLGMAAVLGIVRGHRGAIRICSEPGRGSTFKVLLPACGSLLETCDSELPTGHCKGNGTVLLVDDEEELQKIAGEMLKELGFAVVIANDGCAALEIAKARDDIAFVILDLTMPRMDGEQCFRELGRLRPSLKVIMSSGYSEQEIALKFAGRGLAGFLQKPYTFSALREAISKI